MVSRLVIYAYRRQRFNKLDETQQHQTQMRKTRVRLARCKSLPQTCGERECNDVLLRKDHTYPEGILRLLATPRRRELARTFFVSSHCRSCLLITPLEPSAPVTSFVINSRLAIRKLASAPNSVGLESKTLLYKYSLLLYIGIGIEMAIFCTSVKAMLRINFRWLKYEMTCISILP